MYAGCACHARRYARLDAPVHIQNLYVTCWAPVGLITAVGGCNWHQGNHWSVRISKWHSRISHRAWRRCVCFEFAESPWQRRYYPSLLTSKWSCCGVYWLEELQFPPCKTVLVRLWALIEYLKVNVVQCVSIISMKVFFFLVLLFFKRRMRFYSNCSNVV